jgi:Icc-related predicted phosphoesterase
MSKLICAISDTHTFHDAVKINACDMLIHAGDISSQGGAWEFDSFFRWFMAQPAVHKVLVAGNHDFELHKYPKPQGLIYPHHEAIDIDGVKIFGSPHTPNFYNWAYMYDEDTKGVDLWKDIPLDTEVLITHGPPLGIGDWAGENAGSASLLERVKQVNPKFHIYGHIHEGYGLRARDKTCFLNASVVNDRYKPINPPIYFELE